MAAAVLRDVTTRRHVTMSQYVDVGLEKLTFVTLGSPANRHGKAASETH